ncbi:serine protease [Dolichospermum planctonicum]|uniref:Tetratricopeptide repeat protein n=1 Tax=Dolichospermum planctonicum TaxID=136072 RepID=A0A480A9T6_9CYAN|nr:serine protease [Dolichospermum planctonicum]GCL40716.1 tetratricopeptide repeat protein [Dolichospermum planctonicum]
MKYLFFTLICTTALLTIPQQLLLISPQPVTAQEPTKKLLTSAQLQDLAKSITVKILTKNGSASGTLIAKNGNNYTILTNDHVINPGESYRIQAPDGKIYPATVIKEKPPSLKNQDAALFQFQSTGEYTIATLGISAPIAVNQKIVAAGFVNDSAKLVFTEGQISLLPDKSFQGGYRIGYNNKIQPGMSGGPILNYQGEVIGINAVHAYPISDKIYTYIDNSKPSAAERQQMRQYSWGLPIYSVAKIVPEFVAKSPIKIDNSGLRVKKGLIQNIDQIAQEITVLIPNANSTDMGSGVIIAQQGNIYYVLTADHVIWNRDEKKLKNKLEIVAPDNQRYAINVSNAKRMPGVDLAVVQFTSNQKYRVATLANYSLNTKDQKVFVSGFPGNKQQSKNKPHRILTAGVLSQPELIRLNTYVSFNNQSSRIPARIQTVLSDGYDLLYSNITKGGMSGGAVLDTQGRLIGIHGRVEGEISLDFDGEINLGSSSGVPIRTFLNLVEQAGIDSDLKVETTAPATLKKSEEDVISEYLLPLDQVPKNSDDEILWLNYANQLWRSQKYAEAIKAVDKAISKKPNFYQAWYFKGMIFSSEKKYPESIAAFDKALKINPNFAQAWKERSHSLLQSDKSSEALVSLDKAIALSPNQFDLYAWRGRVLFLLQRFPEAIDTVNQSIKIYPHFSAYGIRAFAYLFLGEYQNAIADYTEAIRLAPDSAFCYSLRGLVYSLSKDYKKAIADYTEAIRLAPNNAEYYSSRGNAYSLLNDENKATADYKRAVSIEPKDAEDYKNRGSAYLGLKDYKKAISDFTEAIRIAPKNLLYFQYYQSRAEAYSLSKDNKKAIADFTEAIRLSNYYLGKASLYLQRASQYFQLKEQKQGIADFTEAIRIAPNEIISLMNVAIQFDPKNADYYLSRGFFYALLNKFQEATADYTQAIKIDPKNAAYYVVRGAVYGELKNYKQAVDDYTQAIQLDPKNPTYYRDRGDNYYELKDYKQAINDYTQAIKIDPQYADTYRSRGNVYLQLKEYKQAIDDYSQAIKLDTKNANYYARRGLTYLQLKDYKQAIDDYTQAIKLDPKNAGYYARRGFAYFELKDYKQAINDWTQAIKLDPKNAGYYGARGDAYLQLKDYKQAINDYTQAIQLDPKNAIYYGGRGLAYLQLKDYKLAINDYTQAIQLDPKNAIYYGGRGLAYLQLKDYKLAINDYSQAIKLKPDFTEAYYVRGIAHYFLKDYKQAINDWNQAIKLKPDYPEAYTNLGIVSYEMGEVETAINYWRNAIKINSNFAEAHLALGVALYGKGDQEAGLKSAETALKLDKRYGKIEFLKENGWGEKLIINTQLFLQNPRIKALI